MNVITSLLSSLGVNSTIWIQLAVFLFTFAVLNWFVFKPYMKAFVQRTHNTEGGKDQAQHIMAETEELHVHYEKQARHVNDKIRDVFEKAKAEAQAQQAKILDEARAQSGSSVKKAREILQKQVEDARGVLKKDVSDISETISQKLIGGLD